MNIIDISVPLREGMPAWPGSIGLRREWVKRIDRGDSSNGSAISCDVHLGTHIDAPLHFIDGRESVDLISLEVLCGPVFVADLTGVDSIGKRTLSRLNVSNGVKRILFKTKNSALWNQREFNPDYVALTEDAAEWIAQKDILLVGIDYLSIQRYHGATNVHRILLDAGVAILEGLILSDVLPGHYELFCLPLKLTGSEGAPARAILLPHKETTTDEK